jgi:hypothetical protein
VEEAWLAERQLHSTAIDLLFGGLLQSTVRCSACDGRTFSFEYFLDLSLPLPKQTETLDLTVSPPLKVRWILLKRIASFEMSWIVSQILHQASGRGLPFSHTHASSLP